MLSKAKRANLGQKLSGKAQKLQKVGKITKNEQLRRKMKAMNPVKLSQIQERFQEEDLDSRESREDFSNSSSLSDSEEEQDHHDPLLKQDLDFNQTELKTSQILQTQKTTPTLKKLNNTKTSEPA